MAWLRKGADMPERVASYLARTTATSTRCLEWQGYKSADGYARVNIGNKVHTLTRVLWEHANGAIPNGMMMRHKCDNPKCVNLEHLELGTQADNQRDKAVRGRSAHQRLTDENVRTIKHAQGLGREIAAQFGVSRGLVSRIKNGKCRHHVVFEEEIHSREQEEFCA